MLSAAALEPYCCVAKLYAGPVTPRRWATNLTILNESAENSGSLV